MTIIRSYKPLESVDINHARRARQLDFQFPTRQHSLNASTTINQSRKRNLGYAVACGTHPPLHALRVHIYIHTQATLPAYARAVPAIAKTISLSPSLSCPSSLSLSPFVIVISALGGSARDRRKKPADRFPSSLSLKVYICNVINCDRCAR